MDKTRRTSRKTTKDMVYYLKKCWKENMLVILCLVVLCGLQVGVNLMMMQAFQGIIDRNAQRFLVWTLLLVAVWFVIQGLASVETFLRCRVIRIMNNAIRRDMAEKLLGKSYQSFHEQTVGEYLSQFTNDMSQIENQAWNPFFDCVRSAVTVVLSIVALLTLHWSLLVASIMTTAIMMLVPRIFYRKMEDLGTACTQEQAAAVNRLKDMLAGCDVLRFFGYEQRFVENMGVASDQIERPKFRLAYMKSFVGAGVGCANIVCQMLHVVLIGILSVRGIILMGALTGGGNLCGNLSAGLGNIVQDMLSMSSARPYFEKISAHIDVEEYSENRTENDVETNAETAPCIPIEEMQDGIALDQVSFSYDKKTVLKEFSVFFKKGGKYALVGPSGCGKSTLLRLMLGCLPEYTGSIRLDNREIRDYRPEQLWHQISYIEQDVFLFNATILDNITLGQEFGEEQIWKALRDSALENDLSTLPDGLNTIVGENGSNLSGGQKQRVAIARALVHNRSILLVDEGTSALDQKNADIVEKSLLDNPELTLILVSHHLSSERKEQFTQVFDLQPPSLCA